MCPEQSVEQTIHETLPRWIRWAPWWPTGLMLLIGLLIFWPGKSQTLGIYFTYALESCASTAIGLIVGFAIRLWHDQNSNAKVFSAVLNELNGKSLLVSLLQHIQNVDDVLPYNTILAKHVALKNLMPVFTRALDDIFGHLSSNGLVLVEADVDKYIKVLEASLEFAETSFEAIIIPPYFPSWFFRADQRDGRVILSAQEKQKYLRIVANASGFADGKRRLLLYPWTDASSEGSIAHDIVNNTQDVMKFIEICCDVDLWLLDREKLSNTPHGGIADAIGGIERIGEDYAVFDRKLVIKQVQNRGLHIIPVAGVDSGRYTRIFNIFAETKNMYWIDFTKEYVKKSQEAGRLLSRAEL